MAVVVKGTMHENGWMTAHDGTWNVCRYDMLLTLRLSAIRGAHSDDAVTADLISRSQSHSWKTNCLLPLGMMVFESIDDIVAD